MKKHIHNYILKKTIFISSFLITTSLKIIIYIDDQWYTMIYKIEKNILYAFRIYQKEFFTMKNIHTRKNNQSCIKNVVSTDILFFLKPITLKLLIKKIFFFV